MNALVIFIRRPVLASMVTALLLVLGLFSYRTLGVDLMPKIELPIVTITTVLRGASPEEIESQVTKPIEGVVNTIEGIDEMKSVSVEGISRITIRFVLERRVADAAQDVRDKVATVRGTLPEGTEASVISKLDFDAIPVLTLAVTGSRDMKEISEIARLKVKEAIENVSGVGAVLPVGNWIRAVNVVLDLDKLQAYGISIARVKVALATQNVEIPSGRIDRGASEQVLRTLARIEKVEDFKKIVVTTVNGRQITIGDIGRVEDSVEEPRSLARLWTKDNAGKGTPAVSLVIQKQSGTNTIDVITNVKKRLKEIEPTLPPGVKISIVADQSKFIVKSIDELRLHLVLGGILASLAVLLFMRNLRSTIIAAVAIPTSLIATFAFMRALNFTLNNMSLLGLTLAVGIVIDDAIVVLENIFRHMEEYGKERFQAAVDGLQEIGLAVMATTTSLVVIFIPVAFMQGMAGRFFYEFGLTVAFSIAVSLVVSFTLTPMLSSQFLRVQEHGTVSKQNRLWLWIESGYDLVLRWSLRNRMLTVALSVLMVISIFPLLKMIGKDFLPADDRSEFQVSMIVPAGSSLSCADEIYSKIEQEIHKVRGVTITMAQIGSTDPGSEDLTQGTIYVSIVDLSERNYSQKEVMKEVRAILARFPEVRSSVNDIEGIATSGRQNYQLAYNLTGPDLDSLFRYSNEVAKVLRKTPGFVDVDTSLVARQPEVRVKLNRPKAADLGIAAADIALSLRTMVGGERVTKFREGVEQYDVWLRLEHRDRSDAEIISRLPLFAPKAGLVPLSQVADLSEGRGPSEIDRFNRQRLVTIYANLENLDLGRATEQIKTIVQGLKLPPSYTSALTGRAKQMGEGMMNMLLAFILAFIFMYIVLAAQFESFLHPVTILLALPLTLPFALVSLIMLGETLNIYSLLGVFMLFGIVKKNGILQIDYTNTLISRGMALKEAILEANHARLRPILMTTLTLIAGMIPIALGTGPGAASRASMAKVIIGGQALSLLITLLIVPVAYSLFEGAKARFGIGASTEKKRVLLKEEPEGTFN
ncbi:MAG: efflux RND transporter permease subunit [Proteobacteria bacterium]|nr:efflux RND transporter permease subunit [Pseudomonadota bacterium]